MTEHDSELEATSKLPPPEEYAKFIEGIKLQGVRLVESRATSAEAQPNKLAVKAEYSSEIARLEGNDPYSFEAYPQLKVTATIRDGEEVAGEVEVRFGLMYESELEPTEGFLEVFSRVNLQLTAWPYLREFVQQATARFGWPPLVLPVLKTASSHKAAQDQSIKEVGTERP